MKAIFTTSAYPFHYGHLDLYKKAVRLFGKKNVSIAIGKNPMKNVDFNIIKYHLTPYNVKYQIAESMTFIDYCEKNNISYLVRGMRNIKDGDYELRLNCKNKKLCSKIETILLPSDEKFIKISSSAIRYLLKYNKINVVKEYMNEDSMYRFINKKPKFVIFFGKSCIGKSYFLDKKFSSKNIVNVDYFLWKIFEYIWGEKKTELIRQECRYLIYSGQSIETMVNKYSNTDFWRVFFTLIEKDYKTITVNNKINISVLNNIKVFLLDFASIGFYWKTIPADIRGQCFLIKLKNSIKNRQIYIKKKGFENKVEFLDKNYKDPNYFDNILNLQYEKL